MLSNLSIDVVEMTLWWDRPHDVVHMVVDLCQVLDPSSARWRESETAWLAYQECGQGVVENS